MIRLPIWLMSIGVLVMPFEFVMPLEAATLRESIYMTLAWGDAPGQAGHWMPPKGGNDEGEWSGPDSFAINVNGDIGLVDSINERLQILSLNASVRQSLSFHSLGASIDDIDADEGGQWFLVGQLEEKKRESWLWNLLPGRPPDKVMNLTALGLRFPLNLEVGWMRHILVQDNHDFVTYELSLATPTVLSKNADDDRLLFLAGRGLYTFRRVDERIEIHRSEDGKELAVYPDGERTFSVIGVSRPGTLFVLYQVPRSSSSVLEGLSSSGQKVFSIPLADRETISRLTPTRLAGMRNVRVGPDGFIYAMGNLQDDQFRIYRYEMKK
jgi:hypothetical protein